MAASFNTPDFIKAISDAKSVEEQIQARQAVSTYLKPRLYGNDKIGKDELTFLITNTDFPSVIVNALKDWRIHICLTFIHQISELGSNEYSLSKFIDEGIAEIIVDRFLPECRAAIVFRGLWVIMKNSDYAAHYVFDVPDIINTLEDAKSKLVPGQATKARYIDMICDELSKISCRRTIKAARN